MRKILILFLFLILLLGIAVNVYAVEIKLYNEKWLEAKYDYHQNGISSDSSYDLSSNFFGFELAARRFYFGVERGLAGNVKYSSGNMDLEISDIRFGGRVVKNDVCTFDIFYGLLFMDGIKTYDDDDNAESSFVLGGNLNFDIADRVLLQGRYEIPMEGDIFAYYFKAGILLNPNVALTAGYRGYECKDENDNNTYYYKSSTSKLTGMTFGLELKF
jgi:hypothetical protein